MPSRRRGSARGGTVGRNMSEPLYRNVTRSIPVPELPAELRNALHTHANQKKLGLIAARAWLTHRESTASRTLLARVFRRSFGAKEVDAWQEIAFVLHATHILLAARGQLRPGHVDVFSLPLANAAFTNGADGFDPGRLRGGAGSPGSLHGARRGSGCRGVHERDDVRHCRREDACRIAHARSFDISRTSARFFSLAPSGSSSS